MNHWIAADNFFKRNRILTGERVQNASSGFSQDSGGAEVNITWTPLVVSSWQMQHAMPWVNVMAVLFIENK